jgi:hypothetical protein
MTEERDEPDPALSAAEREAVARLTADQLNAIDEALVANACDRWRKVARVVGTAMSALRGRVSGIPDVFYAQRVRELVAAGRLESQGNLAFMGYSEIRLPSAADDT